MFFFTSNDTLIKLKCFFNFIVIHSVSVIQIQMSLSFLGAYKRGLRGSSRFVWNQDSLGIIIRGLFQFHRSGRRLPLHLIAPHLRGLIREYVKDVVCKSNGYSNWAEDQFDLVCDRWVRLPSLRAVLLKLQEFSVFIYLVSTTAASYRSLCDDGVMSVMFYRAMMCELSRMASSHPGCTSYLLAAVPRVSTEAVFGYCFTCGVGLSDKIDFNFIPRCCCLDPDAGGSVSVCSSCFDTYVDDDD
jgi:hypothetical protein